MYLQFFTTPVLEADVERIGKRFVRLNRYQATCGIWLGEILNELSGRYWRFITPLTGRILRWRVVNTLTHRLGGRVFIAGRGIATTVGRCIEYFDMALVDDARL
ncbi:MAG TPA: hypothetical protein DD456_13160 [Stenotrophomonas sp.]|nr:hypothetical protein [Stenotrophomonas sp.]